MVRPSVSVGVVVPAHLAGGFAAVLRAGLREVHRDGLRLDASLVEALDVFFVLATAQSEPIGTPGPVQGSEGRTMSAKQAASTLGVTTRAVVKRAHRLGGSKVAGQWVFSATTIERQRSA